MDVLKEAIIGVLELIFAFVGKIPLPVVIFMTCFIGLTLLTLLIAQARDNHSSGLKRHRPEGPGVADLLNWAAVVDDGIIVNKDGSLMAAWLYRGNDNASATNAERNSVSHYINSALISSVAAG